MQSERHFAPLILKITNEIKQMQMPESGTVMALNTVENFLVVKKGKLWEKWKK